MKLISEKPSTWRIIRFSIALLIYLLFVIWIGNYWLLFGIPIIFDVYISKKVRWNPLAPREGEVNRKKWKEWVDAIVFALVVSTIIKIFWFQLYAIPTGSLEKTLLIGDRLFVSKLSYGPQMPVTPIAFPLAHHTMPFTSSTPAYLEWIKWKPRHLKGLGDVERNDIVVFNFPVGDTVLVGNENPDYYQHVRMLGRNVVDKQFTKIVRPLDKKENFVKRCVAVGGDTLEIKDSQVYVNGKPAKAYDGIEHQYFVETGNVPINPKTFEKLNLNSHDVQLIKEGYILTLTDKKVEKIKKMPSVKRIHKMLLPKGNYTSSIFPHDSTFKWNRDNFGPLIIPQKGMTIDLTPKNIILYKRVIQAYENNNYSEKNGKICIDGKPIDKYTFKQNYYWMMGDNRHNSADSRAWGFVPRDHVVGKPVMVFYSLDEEKSFPANIRWDRIFKLIKK